MLRRHKTTNSIQVNDMLVKTTLFAATLIAAFAQSSSLADVTIIEGRSISPPGASPVGANGRIYKLEVSPAKEVSPAFKHRFTVPPHETIAGNAITHYLRSFGERGLSRPWDYAEKESGGEVHDWYSLKTKSEDIPIEKLKQCSEVFATLVSHIDRATLCRDADWGYAIEDLKGIETIGFLLPSVQNTRTMARSLMLQNRLAIIEKRFDDSVDRLRMTYQLGRNVNKMGVLVSSLVGVAEVRMANEGAMLLIGTEGSPNLYWAFAELPTPFIDASRAMQIDISMAERLFPEIMDIENAKFSDDEWKRLLNKYVDQLPIISGLTGGTTNENGLSMKAVGFLGSLTGYGDAKRRLTERGYDKEVVSKMSVAQVILTDASHDIKYFSQMCSKSWHVPYPESRRINKIFEDEIRREQAKFRFGAIISGMLGPAILNVRFAVVRSEAQINLLMAIESLRNHAAIHGKFPQSLTELDLPVRTNPITGKPFNYSLEAGKAVLTCDFQGGDGIDRYEISIKN